MQRTVTTSQLLTESRFRKQMLQEPYRSSLVEALNITDEMLSPLSITRQLIDQISLAKAFVIISKDNNNLQLASDLSFQIHHSQFLLSSAATLGTQPSPEEAELAIRNMASLLYQAQQLNHYDTASTIAKLKSQIQSLEEKSKSETEKSTKFGQIAAEELPKALYCLAVRLTAEWFRSRNLRQKLSDSRRMATHALPRACLPCRRPPTAPPAPSHEPASLVAGRLPRRTRRSLLQRPPLSH